MVRKRNKNIGLNLGDLPSNYVLKIEENFILNEEKMPFTSSYVTHDPDNEKKMEEDYDKKISVVLWKA